MRRQTKTLQEVYSLARRQFDHAESAIRDERLQCAEDRRFCSIAGAQWEGEWSNNFKNKPKLEINKVQLSVVRILNDLKENKISVYFIPNDGSNDDPLADTATELFRGDEDNSLAEEAYDNGVEEGVTGGMGAWRLRPIYEDEYDEENEKQRIRVEPIFDADISVYFDPGAKTYDKSDADYVFVLTAITRDKYMEDWGDDPSTWSNDLSEGDFFDWAEDDYVYVAEYYKVEEKKESIFYFQTIDGTEEKYWESDFEKNPDLALELEVSGSSFVRDRKVKKRKIHKYIMSGNGILDDCGYIPGPNLPIIPYYGKRWYINSIERMMGHVRMTKDAQRLKNMQMSKLAEISASSIIEKPIFTPEQISGNQDMWAKGNIENYAYFLINREVDAEGNPIAAGPVGYTKPAAIPPATAALLQLTDADIREILGNQEQGEKMVANASVDALNRVQLRLDAQSYIYQSNLEKSKKRTAEVWQGMARELYVERSRKMRGSTEMGTYTSIEINRPVQSEETKEVVFENDISKIDYDVKAVIGPGTESKRNAIVEKVISMMQYTQDPQTLDVLSSMAFSNMEGEGIGDIREFFRNKLILMGVIEPTEEEQEDIDQELENQPPDPNSQYLQAAASEAEANAARARADTLETIASSEKIRAQTAETIAKTAETEAKTIKTLSEVEDEEERRVRE